MIIKSETEARSFLLYCYFIGYTDIKIKKLTHPRSGQYNISPLQKSVKEEFENMYRCWKQENKVSKYLQSLGLLN